MHVENNKYNNKASSKYFYKAESQSRGRKFPKHSVGNFLYMQKNGSQWRWNSKQISLISVKSCMENIALFQNRLRD